MESKTKSGFSIIQMVEIPETYLRKKVLKELTGRGILLDSETEEEVFSADVFEAIACEQAELPDNSPLKLKPEDIAQIDEIATELGQYELVRINKV
jgi:hypothetical protein